MSDDRMKLPPERDFGFYQRRKHDKWRAVEPPALEAPVIDTHAHIHMLPDPAWELARCAANGVAAVCEICDPSEDALSPADDNARWQRGCAAYLAKRECEAPVPDVRMAAGVHPHNASRYSEATEQKLLAWLEAPQVVALGEIGLDYHYDLSPRDVQRRVFRRQIELAKQLGLPVALHLRGGDDPQADNAHAEAFGILQEAGFPPAGTLLHCCALPPEELRPWIDAGCFIAYGGALTFRNGEAAREGARIVPVDRLLLETDSPYMAPEPMRGTACTPAHVVFTAQELADVRGCTAAESRAQLLEQLVENAHAFFDARVALQ